MKARKLLLLIATSLITVAGTTAYASDKWLGDRGDNWEEHITSTKTRAQVINELNEARAQGMIGARDTDYPVAPAANSTRTRAEVRAEAIKAAKNPASTIEYSSGQ